MRRIAVLVFAILLIGPRNDAPAAPRVVEACVRAHVERFSPASEDGPYILAMPRADTSAAALATSLSQWLNGLPAARSTATIVFAGSIEPAKLVAVLERLMQNAEAPSRTNRGAVPPGGFRVLYYTHSETLDALIEFGVDSPVEIEVRWLDTRTPAALARAGCI